VIDEVGTALRSLAEAKGLQFELKLPRQEHVLTEIRVIDTGIGIRTEDQARLFQALTQLESVTSIPSAATKAQAWGCTSARNWQICWEHISQWKASTAKAANLRW
jgi:hypothetical protein